jgi:hypothetical protein
MAFSSIIAARSLSRLFLPVLGYFSSFSKKPPSERLPRWSLRSPPKKPGRRMSRRSPTDMPRWAYKNTLPTIPMTLPFAESQQADCGAGGLTHSPIRCGSCPCVQMVHFGACIWKASWCQMDPICTLLINTGNAVSPKPRLRSPPDRLQTDRLAEAEVRRAEAAERRAEALAERLGSLGIDPDQI